MRRIMDLDIEDEDDDRGRIAVASDLEVSKGAQAARLAVMQLRARVLASGGADWCVYCEIFRAKMAGGDLHQGKRGLAFFRRPDGRVTRGHNGDGVRVF